MGNYAKIQLLGNALSDAAQAGTKRIKLRKTLDDGRVVPVTSFDSMEDLQFAMDLVDEETGKNLYHTNAAYRESVKEIVANSPGVMSEPTLARRSVVPTQDEFLKGLKIDALRQKRQELEMQAGGSDLVAKWQAVQMLLDPELVEAFDEMERATEQERPMETLLKQRKQAGLPPMRTFDIEEALNGDQSASIAKSADADGHIIEIGEQS